MNRQVAGRPAKILLPLCAAFAVVFACSEAAPPAHAHRWEPLGHQARRYVHSTVAAAVVVPPVVEAPPALLPPARASASVPQRAPKKASIRLFTADGADCPTEALGVVSERAYGDVDLALERLKDKARAMGADAIVGYRTASGGALGTDLAGVAVHCQRLAEDKPYDTIDHLEVPATAGAEQEAFDELLARADRMHANLVIDVHVVPDPSGIGRKVVGAAIRYR